MKFRTIVADPPWHYDGFAAGKGGRWADGTASSTTRRLPYGSMSLSEIEALPVGTLAATDARLFLWTTNRYLPAAIPLMETWGFQYRQTIIWHKTGNPTPFGGHLAPNHAEYLLVGVKGKPKLLGRLKSTVLTIDTNPAVLSHSQKPEAFLDYIEQVSPAPRLELFARRNRLGWETWGDESLQTVEMPAA